MLKHQKWQLATLLNARLSREVQCRADCRDEHGTGLDRTEANFAGSVLDRTEANFAGSVLDRTAFF